MVVLYVGTFFVAPEFAREALRGFGESMARILPLLLLVFIIMFLSFLWVKGDFIRRHLGRESGWKGWFYAIVGSIATPAPPYILFPLLGEYKKQGMTPALLAIFLNVRSYPPAFVPVMAYYFGWTYTIIFGVYVFAFAYISALVIGYISRQKR